MRFSAEEPLFPLESFFFHARYGMYWMVLSPRTDEKLNDFLVLEITHRCSQIPAS